MPIAILGRPIVAQLGMALFGNNKLTLVANKPVGQQGRCLRRYMLVQHVYQLSFIIHGLKLNPKIVAKPFIC